MTACWLLNAEIIKQKSYYQSCTSLLANQVAWSPAKILANLIKEEKIKMEIFSAPKLQKEIWSVFWKVLAPRYTKKKVHHLKATVLKRKLIRLLPSPFEEVSTSIHALMKLSSYTNDTALWTLLIPWWRNKREQVTDAYVTWLPLKHVSNSPHFHFTLQAINPLNLLASIFMIPSFKIISSFEPGTGSLTWYNSV